MIGCLKNEFIKFKNKWIPLGVLIVALSLIMILHIISDVRNDFAAKIQQHENSIGTEVFAGAIEKRIDNLKTEVADLRSKAEVLIKNGEAEKAQILLDNADFDEREVIPRYCKLLEHSVNAAMWQCECTNEVISAIANDNEEVRIVFQKALDDNDYMLYLQTMCDMLKEPEDDLELMTYFRYAFLLETKSVPDKNTQNWSRATKYQSNMYELMNSGSDEEKQKLLLENEWLIEAAKHNASNPDVNAAMVCITGISTLISEISSVGLIGVFSAAVIFGVDRKRKKIPPVYLLPASRSSVILSKLLASFFVSIVGTLSYSLIFGVSALVFSGKSMFETVFIVLLGKSVFCTPFSVFLIVSLAMIPTVILVISFVFFVISLTKNTPAAAVSGVVLSILLSVFRIRLLNGGDEAYWFKYSIVSVSDWTPFVLNSLPVSGQSFLWTSLSFLLHVLVLVIIGLLIESRSED